jgi:hypothetical protein
MYQYNNLGAQVVDDLEFGRVYWTNIVMFISRTDITDWNNLVRL